MYRVFALCRCYRSDAVSVVSSNWNLYVVHRMCWPFGDKKFFFLTFAYQNGETIICSICRSRAPNIAKFDPK